MTAIRRLLALSLIGVAALPSNPPAWAGETAESAPATATATSSAATTNELVRDPFWPVGYSPRTPELQESWPATNTAAATAGQPAAPPAPRWPVLKLKGVTKMGNGEFLGLIEGVGVVQSGDAIKLEQDGTVYRWDVVSVGPDRVNCRPASATPAKGEH